MPQNPLYICVNPNCGDRQHFRNLPIIIERSSPTGICARCHQKMKHVPAELDPAVTGKELDLTALYTQVRQYYDLDPKTSEVPKVPEVPQVPKQEPAPLPPGLRKRGKPRKG